MKEVDYTFKEGDLSLEKVDLSLEEVDFSLSDMDIPERSQEHHDDKMRSDPSQGL